MGTAATEVAVPANWSTTRPASQAGGFQPVKKPESDSQSTDNRIITTENFQGVERSEIRWSYLPRPDQLIIDIPNTHCVIITNEGGELTRNVVAQLTAEGHRVAVLNLPNIPIENAFNQHHLGSQSDSDIKNILSEITQRHGQIAGFIHLHPHFEFQKPNFAQHFTTEKNITKSVFLLAKHLQQPLNEFGESHTRAQFLTVTRIDGKLGTEQSRGNVSVVGGGLTGLVKCLNQEWKSVYCRAVDIQPELNANFIAQQILDEFYDANAKIVEVGISNTGRGTLKAFPTQLTDNEEITTTITSESTFLVSGGGKGITATCVIEMAAKFKCKFILLGRSDASYQIPAFAKNVTDANQLKRLIMEDLKAKGEKPNLKVVKQIFNKINAKREIETTLNAIATNGGQAVYLSADVTNAASIKQQLNTLDFTFKSITGIIHGAGRLADKLIQNKTEQDFENVLSVKLDGLLSLLRVVNINNLDHLILFSSVAGFYGNVGQSDYAIANEILSKAAYLFKTNHPKTQVSAINWGAWDSGMVSPQLKKLFDEHGIKLVSSDGGAARLVNELNVKYANQPQVIIGGTLPVSDSFISEDLKTQRVQRQLTLADNPFVKHHTIQGNPVLPVVNAVGWMAQVTERLYPGYQVFKVEDTKLFKGIVFDGKQAEHYTLEVKETAKTAEQIDFIVTVMSNANQKLPTYHYRTKIVLVHRNHVPAAPKFQPDLSFDYQTTKGNILYQDGSLFHDHYFQGITEIIDLNKNQMILKCTTPVVPTADQGQFPVETINTFFADIQYQGMVVWVDKMYQAKSLPLSTESATIYKKVNFNQELFVHVAVREHSDFKMVADCTTYDAEGNVYLKTEGAAITVSKDLTW
ncbi:MAG: SDR family NAD(P)-dependent oxidoreductase [Saprospiraceae bacterium]